MAESSSLKWSSPYVVAPTSRLTQNLPGDKILLPPSALEGLLAASPVAVTTTNHHNTAFDPFNPYSLAQARQEASQWRDTQQQLPHPLTFRLVNPKTGSVVYAGIREFSAEEGQIGLSPFLMKALDIERKVASRSPSPEAGRVGGNAENPIDLEDEHNNGDMDRIMVHARELPKGTYVRLRPLEAGYNPEDWKSLLERHLRANYTTLTNGEILTIPGDRAVGGNDFQFLIDKFAPEGEGICVVDTDLEVDIEALNEEQARETLRQISSKSRAAPGTAEGSSPGGKLDIWNKVEGQVLPGEYVDYELPSWDRTQGIEIELNLKDSDELDLFMSPLSTRQRAKPRSDEHVFGDFTSDTASKTFRLKATNVELEGAESLYIAVHAHKPELLEASDRLLPRNYSLRARIIESSAMNVEAIDLAKDEHGPDEEQCKNCRQWVPKRTIMLHENFCLRNNAVCPLCEHVFKKSSREWQSHWHCPHDSAHGNLASSFKKHNEVYHKPVTCSSCSHQASSLRDLAQHRTTLCPGKLILCQFCHLSVPQEGDPESPSPEALMSGLTAHELADGSRTTDCHLCQAIVRLRDMATHLKHHELSRQSKPLPRICRNINCGRTLDGVGKNGDVGSKARMGQGAGNELGLCSICFGPLYVSMHDPEGKAMKRRIERRYLSQLIQGCGKTWCTNEMCKQGRINSGNMEKGTVITTKDALPQVKDHLDGLHDTQRPIFFCVDEGSQKRRNLAEMLAAENVYEFEWCIAACEAENGNLDAARQWLANWAPKRSEAS